MTRKQFAARIWSKLVSFQRDRRLLVRGDRLLAGVSGGPDSVCLAHYLAQESRRVGFTLALIHVHHGLRGRDADRDEALVRRLGAALGTEVLAVRGSARALAAKRRMGLEDAGRKLRYSAFASAARRGRFNKVATAHHLDDLAETVLLNILRSGKAAGIPVRRPLAPRVEVVRPLLCLTRAEIAAYLTIHGLKSRTDKTNRDEAFLRNWIRRKALPLLETRSPRVREHLARLSIQSGESA